MSVNNSRTLPYPHVLDEPQYSSVRVVKTFGSAVRRRLTVHIAPGLYAESGGEVLWVLVDDVPAAEAEGNFPAQYRGTRIAGRFLDAPDEVRRRLVPIAPGVMGDPVAGVAWVMAIELAEIEAEAGQLVRGEGAWLLVDRLLDEETTPDSVSV